VSDVFCRYCKQGPFHETTSKYDPDEVTTGDMLRLKEPYRSRGWTSFPERKEYRRGSLECPGCGAPYPDKDGKVTLAKKVTRRLAISSAEYEERRLKAFEMYQKGVHPEIIAAEVGLSRNRVASEIKSELKLRKQLKLDRGALRRARAEHAAQNADGLVADQPST